MAHAVNAYWIKEFYKINIGLVLFLNYVVQILCTTGKHEGAVKFGKTCANSINVEKPKDL